MAAAPSQRRINQLLTRDEECTLAELMQEDDGLVVQCRSQNQKLLDFMTRKENLNKLI